MTKLLWPHPRALEERSLHQIWDDFDTDQSDIDWVDTVTDTGTVTVGDAANGVAALVPSDCTVGDNDEAYLESPNETFLFAANKPILFEARVQFTEANTDDANILVGLKDAVAANTILDNGGGPAASYSGMVFFKVDGGTVWNCETSIAGTQTTTELSASNANNLSKVAQTAGGAAYQVLRMEFMPFSSTQADVLFYVDGVLVAKHLFTYTSATEMQICFGVKNGGTNLETLNVDYVYCGQLR
jgi:hypothetical protein